MKCKSIMRLVMNKLHFSDFTLLQLKNYLDKVKRKTVMAKNVSGSTAYHAKTNLTKY